MTDKHPADQVRDAISDFAAADKAQEISALANILGDIGAVGSNPDLVVALDDLPTDQADGLRTMLAQAQALEALSAKLVTAEAAGDTQAMQALTAEFQSVMPMPEFEPNPLDPPYDLIEVAIQDDDVAALESALAGDPALNVHLGRYGSFPLASVMRSHGSNRLPMAKLMLTRGADAAFATPEGYTALHVLMDCGDRADTVALIDVLIANGAPTEAVNHYGWTPLLQGIMEGSAVMIEALLERGANVHARFPDQSMPPFTRGCTAMMAACYEPDKIGVLLAYGADPAGAHDNGRGFNRYADAVIKEGNDARLAALVEDSRALINAAKLA